MARYPALTAIVAHMGAPDYGEFLRLAADHERVAMFGAPLTRSYGMRINGFTRNILEPTRGVAP